MVKRLKNDTSCRSDIDSISFDSILDMNCYSQHHLVLNCFIKEVVFELGVQMGKAYYSDMFGISYSSFYIDQEWM